MSQEITPSRNTYVGIFIVALSTLMYEILLTRIFSVTMWYHYGFLAISVAMFGMAVGAIIVYLRSDWFQPNRVKYCLAVNSFWFSVSIVLSFLTYLCIPFVIEKSVLGIYSVVLIYTVISVPFVFSGICVCLVLTKFPHHVSRLYAADLAGAAIGCLLLIYVMKITDGPSAVIVIAIFVAIATFFLAADSGSKRIKQLAVVLCLVFTVLAVSNTYYAYHQNPKLRLKWIKGGQIREPLYQKWNSFSLVTVQGDEQEFVEPKGWGLSSVYPKQKNIRQILMQIDAAAGTQLTAYDGDFSQIEFLKYDIVNLVHYLRPQSKILVVGIGGGYDILSALAFDQASVLGVEINRNIIDTLNQRFGDFSGHLDQNPRVRFVNDEARSYIARQTEKFDIIQVSLIDTWAATAAGAYVLTENTLYTLEAWELFLEKLSDRGVLTFSRWYHPDRPGEVYRLVRLASETLFQLGIENPRRHIIIARHMNESTKSSHQGVGTILVGKQPFSDEDVAQIEKVCAQMKFEVVLSPNYSLDENFSTLSSEKNIEAFLSDFPLNVNAPTDNNPFFFHMLKLQNIFDQKVQHEAVLKFNMRAVFILAILMITVVVLTLLCIIVPLVWTTRSGALKGSAPILFYFTAIGLGFMFVEISQMQRLIIFLGHPTYGLSIVLFSLLLSSGLGSFTTHKIGRPGLINSIKYRWLMLVVIIALFGILTPYAAVEFRSYSTIIRIVVATIILFPLGLFMGMAFPIGMKCASTRSPALTPWLWGINGATSVCASVFAIALSLFFNISTSFWTGFACYLAAFIVLLSILRKVDIGFAKS